MRAWINRLLRRRPPGPLPTVQDVGELTLTVVFDDDQRFGFIVRGYWSLHHGEPVITTAKQTAFNWIRQWHRDGVVPLFRGYIPVHRVKDYEFSKTTEHWTEPGPAPEPEW